MGISIELKQEKKQLHIAITFWKEECLVTRDAKALNIIADCFQQNCYDINIKKDAYSPLIFIQVVLSSKCLLADHNI